MLGDFDDDPDDNDVSQAAKRVNHALACLSLSPEMSAIMGEGTRNGVSRTNFLLATLAFLSACVPDRVRLPGAPAAESPLCVFSVVTGPAGAGKSSLLDALREMIPNGVWANVVDAEPGSGEGLHDAFLGEMPDPDDPEKMVRGQTVHNVLVSFDELEALVKQASWGGSTLWSRLRTAWSGKTLRANLSERDKSKRVRPPVSDYQVGMIAASTYEDAAVLFKLRSRGTADRFLCGWNFDPDRPPKPQKALVLELGDWPRIGESTVVLADQVHAEIAQNVEYKLDDDPRAVWGHGLLARLRVAALVGWLCGHPGRVDIEDWNVASWVVYLSNAATVLVIDRGKDEAAQGARDEGELHGHRDIGKEAVKAAHAAEVGDWLEARARKCLSLERDEGLSRSQALKQATCGNHIKRWRGLVLNPKAAPRDLRGRVAEVVERLGCEGVTV